MNTNIYIIMYILSYMELKFQRLIRRLSSTAVGVTFPKVCQDSIKWLEVGQDLTMEVKEDETGNTIIVLSQAVIEHSEEIQED